MDKSSNNQLHTIRHSTSVRTVYRDINERFAYLPLEKIEHGYRLDMSYLGKFDF